MSVKMSDDKFTSNLRAPLAYRAIVLGKIANKEPNTWRLCVDGDSGECFKNLVQGFNLLLKDNVLKNNGLQLDQESVRKMKAVSIGRKAKKICLSDSNTSSNDLSTTCKIPGGNSLLTIKHYMKWEDEHSSPYMWYEDMQIDEYRRCYTEDCDY